MKIKLGRLRRIIREVAASDDPHAMVSDAADDIARRLGAEPRPDAMTRVGSHADVTMHGGALGHGVLELTARGIDEVEASLIDRHGDAERGVFELVDEVDLAERVMDWLRQLGISK